MELLLLIVAKRCVSSMSPPLKLLCVVSSASSISLLTVLRVLHKAVGETVHDMYSRRCGYMKGNLLYYNKIEQGNRPSR